ncbi:acyl-CoA dehydrogenase family protein [Kribbella sp. DT2]|uniref:acyl-CoA dehydrogenase family protein n=1 Tax=Kribbella sp. DT2 TaxID=3393427 RepID=UPI003CF7449A
MEWKLSDEQDAYRRTLREWLADVAPAATVRQWLDDADATTFEQRIARDGWTGVGIGEALGGQGGGLLELALTSEELARTAVPSASWLANVLAIPALQGHAPLAERALAGEPVVLLASADQLPDATPALPMDAKGRVSGTVDLVLAGDRAHSFIVVVSNEVGRQLRLVDRQADGVTITPRRLLDRSRSVADVRLDQVAAEPLELDADSYLIACTARAAVLTAADALGASERMLDLSVEYSLQRRQFGVPIGSFQAVKHAAATMLVGIEAARSVVYFAAASVDGDDPESFLHAAAVKAQVTAEAARAADSALTVHGAIGYTWEHDLQLFSKRAKLDEHLYGDPVVWNERIAAGLALV